MDFRDAGERTGLVDVRKQVMSLHAAERPSTYVCGIGETHLCSKQVGSGNQNTAGLATRLWRMLSRL
jgi:hypothetical protein